MKPSEDNTTVIPEKELNLEFGFLDNDRGIYWVGFNVSTRDIDVRPLEVANEVRDACLRLFNRIRSQWIVSQNQE